MAIEADFDDLDAATRFLRNMLMDEPLFSPEKIYTDGANTIPSAIKTAVDDGPLDPEPTYLNWPSRREFVVLTLWA